MAPHSSTLAWKIPWMEEPGRLQSMGSLRVGHDWATSLSLSCIGEGNGNPLQCSCLENPRDGGAWWTSIDPLKRLSSSSKQVKNLSVNIGDIRNLGSVPGLGRSSGGGHGSLLQYSCLESPTNSGAWWATVHRVTMSRTRLKWLRTQAGRKRESALGYGRKLVR